MTDFSQNTLSDVLDIPPELDIELDLFYKKQLQIENSKLLIKAFDEIPPLPIETKINNGVVEFSLISKKQPPNINIAHLLKKYNLWRKGPFKVLDVHLDAEWDARKKWDRIEPSLPNLKNKKILDIGANSGYYMFRLAQHQPKYVIGIDPSFKFKMQFELLQKFSKTPNLYYECLGIEHLEYFKGSFDVIFCMGILYHRKDPLQTLKDLKHSLNPKGTLFLETLMVPGPEDWVLTPYPSYGKMKNAFFIPTESALINWCKRAGFENIEVLDISKTTEEEQRNTEFCPAPAQTLSDFLNPLNPEETVEGYPAHTRIILKLKSR